MALITRANLKTWLKISGTSEDSQLDLIVAGVDAAVKRYCRRDLEQQTYTDILLDGTGRVSLFLPQRPLTAIASLYVSTEFWGGVGNSDAFGSGTEWVRNTDYLVRTLTANEQNFSELIAMRRSWPVGLANIKITYTAGYSTLPDDLVMACYQLAAQVRSYLASGAPIASENFGDYSYTLLRGSPTPEIASARGVLNGFRQVAV